MDITPVVQALIGILAVVMTAFVIPFIKSKTTAQQRADILVLIEIAVAAAEQMSKALDTGEAKKNYVMEFLRGKGVNVDTREIDNMIEAAVWELKNAFL